VLDAVPDAHAAGEVGRGNLRAVKGGRYRVVPPYASLSSSGVGARGRDNWQRKHSGRGPK